MIYCPAVCSSPVQWTAATWQAAWNCCVQFWLVHGGTALQTGMLPVHWNCSSTWYFLPFYDPGVLSASTTMSTGNDCTGEKRSVRRADKRKNFLSCHEIWEPQPRKNFRVSIGLYRHSFTFNFTQATIQFVFPRYLINWCPGHFTWPQIGTAWI